MTYPHFNSTIKSTIGMYVEMLKKDFKENPTFADLASTLFISPANGIHLRDWVNGIYDLEWFDSYILNTHRPLKMDNYVPDIASINYDFQLVKESLPLETYSIFASVETNSYEEIVKLHPEYRYYWCHKDFVKRLDSIIIPCLKDYKKEKRVLSKKITESISLNFDLNPQRNTYLEIVNYEFPSVFLQDGKDIFTFTSGTDTCQFLLLGCYSFFEFFYRNSNDEVYNEKVRRYESIKKSGEPVTYYYEDEGVYELTNPLASIEKYNKFIRLNTELFIHYFRLFEKWVIEVFVPRL